MNLRHLRCFIAVAEELHFGRAARRLHIEQSPLSRTIRQMEADLGVPLLNRLPRSVRLTPAGQVFLEEARRVLLAFEQAQTKARAAANQRNTLRIALSGDMGQARLSASLPLCREEAPQVGIRIFETPLAQLVTGLRNDLYDAGFALAGEMDAGIVAMPVWRDPLVVALLRLQDPVMTSLAIGGVLYLVAMALYARPTGVAVKRALALRMDNEDLVRRLREQTQQAQAARAQAEQAQQTAEAKRLKLIDLRYTNGVASYLDQLDAHLLGEEGVLEVGAVVHAGGQHHHGGLCGGWRRGGTQGFEQ